MSTVMFNLSGSLTGGEWCTLCAGYYKQAVIEHHRARIEELNKDGKDDLVWLTDQGIKNLPPLFQPVIQAVPLMFPQLGPVGLCWSHAPAISNEVRRGLAVADGGILPPGLIRGAG
jgi:hypothetical protein